MDRPELAPFIRMVRKTRIALGVLALICLPFGVLLLFLNDPTMSATANLALKVGLGGFFLCLGGYFAFLALRSPSRHKGIRTLLERADDIVWICPVRNLSHGNHIGTRYNLHLATGETRHVVVAPADEEWAERFFSTRCPTALFGFRREWERQFKADPSSLAPANRAGQGT